MVLPTDRAVTGPIVQAAADFQGLEAGEALEKFDLVYMSAAGIVSETTSGTSAAIGIVDRAYALGNKEVSVLKLDGRVLKMTANAAIGVGVYVMPAANGKVAPWAAVVSTENTADPVRIGITMTAAAGDNSVIDVLTGV